MVKSAFITKNKRCANFKDAYTLTATVESGPSDLAQLYQDLLKRDELAAYEVPQRFYEIGSVDGLNELSLYLASLPKTSI